MKTFTNTFRPETRAVHAAAEVDPATKGIVPPIHLSTTFEHPADASLNDGYLYQRYTNPTQELLERALSEIEGGAASLHFASGLAAGAALLQNLPVGSHVLMADDTYFAFRKQAQDYFARWGLSFSLVDMANHVAVKAAIRTNTKCLWTETPSNPLIKITDLAYVAALAHEHGAITLVDATFASPALLNPIALGCDVVLHSTTKYLGGHSDVMGGALIFARDDELAKQCFETRKILGGIASPFSSWLVLRGLRSLHARMRMHCDNARAVAMFLAQHENVSATYHPSLPSHPGHTIAREQMRDFGGMLSFCVRGERADAIRVASKLKLFINATSLGGPESLVEHRQSVEGPTSTTPPQLLRLSVGLEHPDDLIDDLAQALQA
jgi:cystathionine gamma-synthase